MELKALKVNDCCIEIWPQEKSQFYFETSLTTHSQLRKAAMYISPPELKEFLETTSGGNQTRKVLDGAKRVEMGYVHCYADRDGIMYMEHYPLGRRRFENLLKHKRIGSMIESRIQSFLVKKFPGAIVQYGDGSHIRISPPFWHQLVKRRGGLHPYENGEIGTEFMMLKKQLRADRALKLKPVIRKK